jgi:hypothetical protein
MLDRVVGAKRAHEVGVLGVADAGRLGPVRLGEPDGVG